MSLRLKQARTERHFTQTYLANFLCCSVTTYARYEREQVAPPVHVLILLSDLYQVSIDYLLGYTADKDPYPLSEDYKLIVAQARAQVMRTHEKRPKR